VPLRKYNNNNNNRCCCCELQDIRARTGLMWLMIGTYKWPSFGNATVNFRVHEIRGISGLGEEQLA